MNYFIKKYCLAAVALTSSALAGAEVVANYPMDVAFRAITETVTGKTYTVTSKNAPENIPGARGNALRFDGYSTYVSAKFDPSKLNTNKMTISLWCAVETYPMMNVAESANVPAMFFGNIDESSNKGFALKLSSEGDLSFKCYSSGWEVTCSSPIKLTKYEWHNIVVTFDGASRMVKLYDNGSVLATAKCMTTLTVGGENIMFGKPFEDLYCDRCLINTFNGLIDDVTIYNEVLSDTEIANMASNPENAVDMSIPASRFADSILRPRFHGMPGACWTNEPHGMVKFNGKYHIFFQKNANGPYMARLHWGHISSTDLCTWKEEQIAFGPDKFYDLKGCWSGCVFTDDYLTGGKPNIWYTAVDNGRATIAHATPADDNLISWNKDSRNPVVNGRPAGLSDDFRDCYLFTNNGKYYMIVGTSKDGAGACTLHRYDTGSQTWSNDGSIFFRSNNTHISGTFWEMPNITRIGDKWLFTCTPLGTGVGVEVLYWVGNINDDGTFSPLPKYENNPGKVELDGMSRDGFGLLSPSIMQADGKTIAVGIVPDKLPMSDNYNMGWAHNYSLPREWSIDDDNNLVQKPYSGLDVLRSATMYKNTQFSLNGTKDLTPVKGRKLEILSEFTIGNAFNYGFNLFKSGDNMVKVYYTPASNLLTVDMTSLPRLSNDGGVFNGYYESSLPKSFAKGDVVKMHIFVDNSILDIFINDTWATSIRLFPTNVNGTAVEAFSTGTTEVKSLYAWVLDENLSGVESPAIDIDCNSPQIRYSDGNIYVSQLDGDAMLSLYSLSGQLVQRSSMSGEASVAVDCAPGMYVATVQGAAQRAVKKVLIK